MKRFLQWLALAIGLVVLCRVFPLFHIVPLERAIAKKAKAAFDPTEFAETFWNERLLNSLAQAVPAQTLIPAIQSDPAKARKKFSRSLGLSDSYFYFVAGRGRVLAVTEDEIALAVSEGATTAEVSLQVGLLFNNAVRDGTGLLNVNNFPNSQDFNALSEALNHIVETRVQPALREQAIVGGVIQFVGCAEVDDETMDLKPLKIVPLQAEVQ
jgi:predicted lipoprotein